MVDELKLTNRKESIAFRRRGHIHCEVIDTGVGMTPVQMEHLCKPGVQFNANDLQSGRGSGLGLFICKGLCERHGGTLSAASKGLGKGSTFTVTLPLHQVMDETLQTGQLGYGMNPPTQGTTAVSKIQIKSLRLLVVDDAAINRKLLSRLLTKRGHCCDQAENGQEAVNRVKKAMDQGNNYDAVLLDYEMPGALYHNLLLNFVLCWICSSLFYAIKIIFWNCFLQL